MVEVSGRGNLVADPVVAVLFEVLGETAVARLYYAPVHQDVDEVGADVFEDSLVVGNQQDGL